MSLALITISYKEYQMAEELISEGFPEEKLIPAYGPTIRYYYHFWKLVWESYQQHGCGD